MKKLHQSGVITFSGKEVKIRTDKGACPICDSADGGPVVYKYSEYSIIKCANCSTMHLDPIPDDQSLSLIYNTNYYKDDEEQHGYKDYSRDEERIRKTYRKRFEFIKSNLTEESTAAGIIEIGCALGFGLQEAQGFFNSTVSGADLSLEAIENCQKHGFEVKQCRVDGTFQVEKGRKYGLVYAFDVLEHLKKVDPFITWVNSILSDEGVLALTTPNMDHFLNRVLGKRSPLIKIPQHIIYFTTETLQSALKNRFRLVDSKIDCQYVSIRALLIRIRHIMGLSYKPLLFIPDVDVALPTGNNVYLFKKIDAGHEKKQGENYK